MPVVVVANPKGGVGKSTLSTNIAGYYASQGHPVILGDTDRQESAKLWLGLRPPAARPIGAWDGINSDVISRPPKGTTHAVLDTPAGLHGWRLNDVLKLADKIIVPLQPSVFDIFATRSFLDQLAEHRRVRGADRHRGHARGRPYQGRRAAAPFCGQPGLPGAGLPARYAELHPPGGAWPHAV